MTKVRCPNCESKKIKGWKTGYPYCKKCKYKFQLGDLIDWSQMTHIKRSDLKNEETHKEF